MSAETWVCPGCGQRFAPDVRVCPLCKVTQVWRRPAPAGAEEKAVFSLEAVEVPLPLTLAEARFNVPADTGPTWTSGRVVVTEAGLYFLSEKDALTPEQVVASVPPAVPGRVAALSLFLPRALVARVVHDRLVGFFVESQGQRIPLRLAAEGWKMLDAACDKLGIAHKGS
jgi:hypothetical protein